MPLKKLGQPWMLVKDADIVKFCVKKWPWEK